MRIADAEISSLEEDTCYITNKLVSLIKMTLAI
jgi:hypothetical protein